MKAPVHFRPIAGSSGALLASVATIWSVLWLWKFTGKYDSDPTRGTLTKQMMERKSQTMENILDGMIREDYGRLDRGAQWMKAYSSRSWVTRYSRHFAMQRSHCFLLSDFSHYM